VRRRPNPALLPSVLRVKSLVKAAVDLTIRLAIHNQSRHRKLPAGYLTGNQASYDGFPGSRTTNRGDMRTLAQVVRVAAIAAVVSAGATWAGPIEFVYTGVGSGTLNGVPFAASNFTITEFADTSNRQSCTFGLCTFIDDASATITISGLGSFDFLTPTRTIVSGGVVFLAHAGEFGPNLYDLVPDPPALDNYMLDASIGPLFAFGLLNQWTALPLVDTTGGILIFDDTIGQDSPGSFQAILVPEPQPFALLAGGALALGWSLRKRTRLSLLAGTHFDDRKPADHRLSLRYRSDFDGRVGRNDSRLLSQDPAAEDPDSGDPGLPNHRVRSFTHCRPVVFGNVIHRAIVE